jgi:hypothetical protein
MGRSEDPDRDRSCFQAVVRWQGIDEPDATQGDFICGSHYGYGGEIGSDETE